jgi:ankyrin repeat protein
MLCRLAFPIAVALAFLGAATAQAQVAPTAAEVARYEGLHAAAHAGDVARIRRLAVNSSNLNPRDDRGRTPLHVATFARQRGAIQALGRAGANLNLLDDDRYDAVTIAAVANDEETLRLLLSMGASARQVTSPYHGTALIAAAHLGHAGVVRQLIAAGAPVNHVNNLHWTAVIEAIVLGDGGPRHQATLQALIRARANLKLTDREGRTPLQLAKARGYTEMVKMLEEARALNRTQWERPG